MGKLGLDGVPAPSQGATSPDPESLAINDFLWICEGSDSLWSYPFSPLPEERLGGVGTSWALPSLWSPVVIILIELGTQ